MDDRECFTLSIVDLVRVIYCKRNSAGAKMLQTCASSLNKQIYVYMCACVIQRARARIYNHCLFTLSARKGHVLIRLCPLTFCIAYSGQRDNACVSQLHPSKAYSKQGQQSESHFIIFDADRSRFGQKW